MLWYGLVLFVVFLCFGMVDSELMVEHCGTVAGFYGMVGWHEVARYGGAQ